MDFHTEELEPRAVVFVRTPTRITEIGNKITACLARVGPYVGGNAAGPPFARYPEWDGDGGVIEVGLPVRTRMAGEGDIETGELPGGRAAAVTHVGPYDGLVHTWEALKRWMTEAGLEGRAAPWEDYVDDPCSVPHESLRTLIHWPIT